MAKTQKSYRPLFTKRAITEDGEWKRHDYRFILIRVYDFYIDFHIIYMPKTRYCG